jgi:chloramphenicol-sensitive protein RarD
VNDRAERSERDGIIAGVVAYSIWGLFPLYFPLLLPASPLEIVSHRIVWSLVCVHEKLRPLQRLALVFGMIAVVVLTIGYGRVPLIALVLAISFGGYGYMKKTVVRHEHVPPARWAGFVLVWIALAVLAADAVRAARLRPAAVLATG